MIKITVSYLCSIQVVWWPQKEVRALCSKGSQVPVPWTCPAAGPLEHNIFQEESAWLSRRHSLSKDRRHDLKMVWMFSFWSELHYFLLPKSTGMCSEKRIVWGHLIQPRNITEHLPYVRSTSRFKLETRSPFSKDHPPPRSGVETGNNAQSKAILNGSRTCRRRSRERGQRTTDGAE